MKRIIDSILRQYDFNLRYAKALVADLSDNQMTYTPVKGLENHPAFTLGHLVTGSAMLCEDLDSEKDLPAGWDELFTRKGPGDPRYPEADRGQYPSKDELIGELERQHLRVVELMHKKGEELMSTLVKWRFGKEMPTLLDLCNFMCVTHESSHLGQLAAWRRHMDLPSALATM